MSRIANVSRTSMKKSLSNERCFLISERVEGVTPVPSALENNLNADIFRDLGPHELAKSPFVGIDID